MRGVMQQISLPAKRGHSLKQQSYKDKLIALLSEALDFHNYRKSSLPL
jgi:hypothetical protein